MEHKPAKKRMLVIAFAAVVVVAAVFVLIGTYKVLLFMYDGDTFREYNPKKMITYLENRYHINFPEDIKEVKAAKTWLSWDGWAEFIIKFSAKPGDINKFLESIAGGPYKLHPYNPTEDDRFDYASVTPQWYRSPIAAGKMGEVILEVARIKNVAFPAAVYIDTSDENNSIVYIMGNYKSDTETIKPEF
jgi:hypothetical protein